MPAVPLFGNVSALVFRKKHVMLQLMMDAQGQMSEKLKLDITEMTAMALIFIFGGFDSTYMCAMAQELILNPDIQARLQSEIDAVMVEASGKPTYETISSMPHLETMRKHPQPSVIDRSCTKEFELPPALTGDKPFVVKSGMNVWSPVAAIHHDEQFHKNPKKFDPDRFFNKKVTTNLVENIMGFDIGPRSCIEYKFAILETTILFFYLLSKFTLVPNAKTY